MPWRFSDGRLYHNDDREIAAAPLPFVLCWLEPSGRKGGSCSVRWGSIPELMRVAREWREKKPEAAIEIELVRPDLQRVVWRSWPPLAEERVASRFRVVTEGAHEGPSIAGMRFAKTQGETYVPPEFFDR